MSVRTLRGKTKPPLETVKMLSLLYILSMTEGSHSNKTEESVNRLIASANVEKEAINE